MQKKVRKMSKKPDSVIVLAVLVITGVIISHFVVLNQQNTTERMAISTSSSRLGISSGLNEVIKSRDLVRIDSSRQQIH